MSQITKPIILDETGRDIVDAIESLSNRANDVENFTSSDVEDESATEWTSVTPLESGEIHSSIFAKISQMFKNIRYLYKVLGTTDISAIGDGTITGAVSALNGKAAFPTSAVGGNETLTSGAFKTIATITLTLPGLYICTADIFFDSTNTPGFKMLLIDIAETTSNNVTNSVLGTSRADLHKTRILALNSETTLYLRGYQTSGSSVRAYGRIAYIKIK